MRVPFRLLRRKIGFTFWVTLSIGILFGFSSACIILAASPSSFEEICSFIFGHVFSHDSLHRNDLGPSDTGSFGFHSPEEPYHKGEDKVARKLAERVRVLCWVITSPESHFTRARHVKATWGRRCNILLFMSSVDDASLPAVNLHVPEGRRNIWAKTKEAIMYVYKHFLNDADWFMKADDDMYVIVENLRYMLSGYKPSEALYFGSHFKSVVAQGYLSADAGYVLSQEAIRRFVEHGLADRTKCNPYHGEEDLEMGLCLAAVGVRTGDSRDSLGRDRFFPFPPEYHLVPGHVEKRFLLWSYIFYEFKGGLDCCSDTAISFHYIKPNMMYVLEYLIYHLRPYGVLQNIEQLWPSEAITSEEMLRVTQRPTTDGAHTR